MSRQSKAIILGVSLLLISFTVLGGLGVRASTGNDGAYRQFNVYSEVLARINSEYVEQPNVQAVTDGALHGLLESLDASSSYLTPAEYKQYREHKSDGNGAVGIGATLSKRFGYAAVVSVLPGGPAAKGGVESGDIIEAIENRTTREMSLPQITMALSGAQGSRVNLSVVRARRADPQKLVVVRDAVTVPAVSDKLLDSSSVGYVKVETLPKGRTQEIAAKIKSLQKSGVKKIILDLRDCSEGDEQEGVAVANLFLDHGLITYLQGQKYPRETFNADPQKAIVALPLVVLVNRGTAGPAEIVAAAVLENARGDVVGDRTFGIGSVQKVIDIADGSALILSIAKYYTPGGKAIENTAITPNVLVAEVNDDAGIDEDETPNVPPPPPKKGEDEQLNRALEVLRSHDQKAAVMAQPSASVKP